MSIAKLTSDDLKAPGADHVVMDKLNEVATAANTINAGLVADATAGGTVSNPAGPMEVISILVPDHATQTLSYKLTDKLTIMNVVVLKAGDGAANTIQLTDGADAAISDAIAAAVDKAETRSGTIDTTKNTIAAGGTIKLVCTRAAGTMAALVILFCIKRA